MAKVKTPAKTVKARQIEFEGEQARYRFYVQIIPDIVFEIDSQGKFVFVSNSVKQLGFSPKELKGKHFKTIIHPEDVDMVSRFVVLPRYRGMKTGAKGAPKLFDERRAGIRLTKNLQVRLRPKKKKACAGYRYAEMHSLGIWGKSKKKKSLLGSIGIIRDISARKEAEQKLKKAHQTLRDILERSPLGIYLVNRKGNIEYANPAMINISGCTYERFKGLNVFRESLYKRSGLADKIRFALEGAVFFLGPVEYTWCGSRKSIVGNFTGIPLEGEGDKKVIVFVEDITELKRTQMQLIQAKKMEVIGGLASGVAHEVKNPLAIIVYGTSYLRRRIGREDKKVALALKHIEEAVRRADNIIKDLLDFSSLSRLNVGQEDLNQVIEKSLVLTRHHLNKQHIQVVREFDRDLPLVKVDRNRIEQALVNLILNALESMQKGGVIAIRTFVKKLTNIEEGIGFRKEDTFKLGENVVVLEVEDTGRGIPEINLDKIFDPFFTTKRGIGGTGLGLSIVMNIVKLHNGRIEIKNLKGKGIKVTMMFKV